MDARTKLEIGRRLRRRRENAGYTRERLGVNSAHLAPALLLTSNLATPRSVWTR